MREYYALTDPGVADRWLDELVADLVDHDVPELRRLGRTLRRWQPAIAAFHHTRASNAATEAANNLAKRIKRVAFGIVNWNHWRIRVLLSRRRGRLVQARRRHTVTHVDLRSAAMPSPKR